MGCPDMWSNVILGVSVRVFLNEINIWISRLSKADCPPQCGWSWLNQLMASIEQKGWGLQGKRELLPDCSRAGTSAFSCLHTWPESSALPGSGACLLSGQNDSILPYPLGICSKVSSGCLKLQVVPTNRVYNYVFSSTYIPMIKFSL